ncbi:GGDEF domain-containing protein [Pseudobacteroides cellulosolvens]|uniref:Diguanylate cyclase n=1 Tax=Pseudobacteroides cellulosolvens ATCC 35603 = DSM 2933 TaxID=398512 RepID=A0A0L6JN97_9FIRM|nr:GGDEF domain-containing protein [Pseudobacteroides cellulosolvens]KNY27268.1 diguanylate cyclase [Pseudobacteroides cellulosolvens ATCC 35603 = DSM 2933]
MKIIGHIFDGLCLFSLLMLLCIVFIFPYQSTRFCFDGLVTMDEGWNYSVNAKLFKDVKLPYKNYETKVGDTFSISRILPDAFKDSQAVCIFTAYDSVRATLDGKEIYSYGYSYSDYLLTNNKGFLNNIIPIPAGSNGKKITIEMVSVNSKYSGIVKKISYANHNAVYATLILKKLPGIIVCTFIIMTGILSFIIYFSLRIKTEHLDENFKVIGIFALCSGLWGINQYDFFSLIIGNAQISYFVDYLGLFLMPVSFCLYIYKLCKERCKKIIGTICAMHTLFVLVAFILQITRVKEFFNLLIFYLAILVLEIILVTGTIIYEIVVEKNTKFKLFMIPLMIVLTGALCDITMYYLGIYSERFVVFPISILISITTLMVFSWKRYLKIIADQEKNDLIIKMADLDLMTQAKNRNAFEKEIVEISKNPERLKNIYITEFDLNFLKYINDNYGHDTGDDAIRNCYRLINKIVGTKGEVFRTGGDEFICITYEPIENLQSDLKRMISELNLTYPLKLSYGTASFNPELDEDIQDVIRRSDVLMYKMKEMTKVHMAEYKRKKRYVLNK